MIADTSTVGAHTVMLSASDDAGNVGSANCAYHVVYAFGGFTAPIDPPPTMNLVKAGSAVPVKFSLHGNQGLGILAGAPVLQQSSCSATSPTASVDTQTSGKSGLTYDAASDTYSYVWSTSKSWSGTCGQLVVNFVDGTSHIAGFQFK